MSKAITHEQSESKSIYPVGRVERRNGRTFIEIEAQFRPALKELGRFSHIQVLWWCSELDSEEFRSITQNEPPYEAPITGVFASRSPIRPNPIGLSVAQLLSVDEASGIVEIRAIDAFDLTPVMDIKAYFPCCDRVKEVHVPDWAADWPEWVPEEGIGLED